MTELIILKQFTELFENVKSALENYNKHLHNDYFNEKDYEDNDIAYKRGETIFDQFDENLINLNFLIAKETEINEFFEKCKENKQKIINQKNEIINKLLRIKKNDKTVSKEEFLTIREDWNKRREEKSDERNRRETEEMLEEIKEEKIELNKLIEKVKEKKCEMDVKEEFKQIASEYVKQSEYSKLIKSYNDLVIQHNEIMQNYVKKHDLVPVQPNMINNPYPYQPNMNYQMNPIVGNNLPYQNFDDKEKKQNNNFNNPIQTIPSNEINPNEPPPNTNWNLTLNQVRKLEEWTSLRCKTILFDSQTDNWSQNTSVFAQKLIKKKQLVFLIEDNEGEKFGYYLNTELIAKYGNSIGHERIPTDKRSFEFNIQSNGRLEYPMRFDIKDTNFGGYILYERSLEKLIELGDIKLYKYNKRNKSSCDQDNDKFHYPKINNVLSGKETGLFSSGYFIPTRIQVIQMA